MINFEPNPRCDYKYDYEAIFRDVADGHVLEVDTYRNLILDDLFFIVQFILGVPGANHPFVVKACQEVESGPETNTIDIWAREHFKSTIITRAEIIQKHCRDRNRCIAIFSHTRPIAKALAQPIRLIYETSEMLKKCFPETFWTNPAKDAPKWSEDGGYFLQRDSVSRPEASLEAWGLIEGMPTSKHFDDMYFDDIETKDLADNPDLIEKLKERYDLAMNLGTSNGTKRVIGTYYTHAGLLTHLEKRLLEDGQPAYVRRIKPGTVDGTRWGEPVLVSDERMRELRSGDEYTFNTQILLNPTPVGSRKLEGSMVNFIENRFIPKGLTKVMIIDPAGKHKGDSGSKWAIHVIGVQPTDKSGNLGVCNQYLLDSYVGQIDETAAIDLAVKMYVRNGFIMRVGIEKVALSTTEIHFCRELHYQFRRMVSEAIGNLMILSPKGRKKEDRVEKALSWPLHNGKIYINKMIPTTVIEEIMTEFEVFPYGKYDGLDAWSYIGDVVRDMPLVMRKTSDGMKFKNYATV